MAGEPHGSWRAVQLVDDFRRDLQQTPAEDLVTRPEYDRGPAFNSEPARECGTSSCEGMADALRTLPCARR